MARQNRVDPRGRLIADPARGSWMGNRGVLHDSDGAIRREYALQRWIICRLEFKGRRRSLMTPGQYTELFFLDEATALAAGHRPCAECRRDRYEAFRAAWTAGDPTAVRGQPRATELDAHLHRERIAADGSQDCFSAECGELPDGTFVARGPEPGTAPAELICSGRLWSWCPSGYGASTVADPAETVTVLTPRSTVNAISAGYSPQIGLP